jgi:hypothetical protein
MASDNDVDEQENPNPLLVKGKASYPIIIARSPIEFVLVGPMFREHGILARSKEARIDLIGFAASDRDYMEMMRPAVFSVFHKIIFAAVFARSLNHARSMNAVMSSSILSEQPSADDRRQRYRFCWIGHCTENQRELIKLVLDRQLPDIVKSLKRRNTENAEWTLSPIIFECALENENWKRSRILIQYIMRMYLAFCLIGILTAVMYKYISPLFDNR